VVILSALLGAVVLFVLPREFTKTVVKEGGLVKTASLVLYIIGGLMSWSLALRKRLADGNRLGLIFFLFALRELDFTRRFTTKNIEHGVFITYFFIYDIPLVEKIVVAVVLVLLGAWLAKFISSHWAHFVAALKDRKPYAIYTTLGLANSNQSIF